MYCLLIGLVTTLAGGGSPLGIATGWSNGLGTAALFNSPYGMSVDTAGQLLVCDFTNNLIRLVSPTGMITTATHICHKFSIQQTRSSIRHNVFPIHYFSFFQAYMHGSCCSVTHWFFILAGDGDMCCCYNYQAM